MGKKILMGLVLSTLVLAATSVRGLAEDTIFTAAAQPEPVLETLSLDRLADSPTVRDHQNEVFAAADAKLDRMEKDGMVSPSDKILIKGWFKALPFQRIVDVKVSFLSGVPDLVGLCLEVNPVQYVSIDACAAAIVFTSALSAHVASRFLHYTSINGKTNTDGSISYSGNDFSVGPKVGYRDITVSGIFGSVGTGKGIDTLVSAEWVHWFSRYFGLGLELDAGATIVVQQTPGTGLSKVAPDVKLSLGVSF